MLTIGFKGRAIIKGFTKVVTNIAFNRVTITVEGLGVSGVVIFARGSKGELIIAFYDYLEVALVAGALLASFVASGLYFLITAEGFVSLGLIALARPSFSSHFLTSSVAPSRSLILY